MTHAQTVIKWIDTIEADADRLKRCGVENLTPLPGADIDLTHGRWTIRQPPYHEAANVNIAKGPLVLTIAAQ